MRPYVYSTTIHNSQDTEATEMSIRGWMDKEDVVHIHNGILLSHLKNEVMLFAATWMNAEIIVLSKVRYWERMRTRWEGGDKDEMAGWHHWLNEHEFEKTQGDSEGQGSLACSSSWGHKESDTTQQLNNNNKSQEEKDK